MHLWHQDQMKEVEMKEVNDEGEQGGCERIMCCQ